MRNTFVCLAIVLALLLQATDSGAGGLSYLVGPEAAVEATAQAFATPSLPSMSNEGNRLTPLYGYVFVKGVDDSKYTEGTASAIYDGQLKGQLVSLTFNSSGKGDLGYFIVGTGTKLSGEMRSTISSETDYINNISATGYTGIAGVSYRLLGDAKSVFGLGIFAGPGYMTVKSTETVVQSDGRTANVIYDSDFYGIYSGLQILFRFGKFSINPYLTTYNELSEPCRNDVTVEGPSLLRSFCENGKEGFSLKSSMYGIGLNLGYGPFAVNAISQGMGVHRYLKATSYALSYGFTF